MKNLKTIAIMYLLAAVCFVIAAILQFQNRSFRHLYMNLIIAGLFFLGAFKYYTKYKRNISKK